MGPSSNLRDHFMPDPKHCPHCRHPLPGKLVWKTLFTGQTVHTCPACGGEFRLTYQSKLRVSYLNVILILGFVILWNIPNIPRNLAVYVAVAAIVVFMLPRQARYEKTSEPDH